MKRLWHIYGWLFVRPRRWFFGKMIRSWFPVWYPKKEAWGWVIPNIHWWILYHTVYEFFSWLEQRAWKYFCTYKNGWLKHEPTIAKIIHRIGGTTAGYASHGGECFHCSSKKGCQLELSDDETGSLFILEREWTIGTEDGTDYRFCGTTICPICGFRRYFEDGSL